MIHLLEVGPTLTVADLKKLSRKYAMTGGYELSVPHGLSKQALVAIATTFGPELELFESKNSAYYASNAFRILSLILEHPLADEEVRSFVTKFLTDREKE